MTMFIILEDHCLAQNLLHMPSVGEVTEKVEQGNAGADVKRKEVDGQNSSSMWEPCKSSSHCMGDVRALDVPKWGMHPSRSHICQPQRPNTSKSGAFSN